MVANVRRVNIAVIEITAQPYKTHSAVLFGKDYIYYMLEYGVRKETRMERETYSKILGVFSDMKGPFLKIAVLNI